MTKEENLKAGKIVAFLREAKHLKLREMTGGSFSESQLAKFEKGQTDLTIEKFFILLDNAAIYLDEFQNLYNNYEQSEEYGYQQKLAVAYAQKDISTIKAIYQFWQDQCRQAFGKKYPLLNTTVVKIILTMAQNSKIIQDDIVFLMDYLDSVSEWGRYEIWIFGNCLRFFDDNALKYYGGRILGKTNFYHSLHHNQQMVIRTFLNLIDSWLQRKNLGQSLKYINHLKEIGITIDFFYEKIILMYHEAHYKYLQGNEEGREEMKKHAQTLEDYGYLLEAKSLFDDINHL